VVILLSEMGSIVLAGPMFAQLRRRFPSAHIHVLQLKKNQEVARLLGLTDPRYLHTLDDSSGLRLLRERLPNVPLIVDAGLGVPSHATQVMEWGYDAVLLNTAVAQAGDPVAMAQAFAMATQAGRLARLSGPMPERDVAQASTPVVGLPFWHAEEKSA
jgi:hypothetical protein